MCVLSAVLGCGDSSQAPAPPPSPPARAQPSRALDNLSDLPPAARRAFESHPEDFRPLASPGPNDWLSVHPEEPQSVGDFWLAGPNRPGADGRGTLYIQPLGVVPATDSLRAFASDYFALPVVVLPTLALSELEVRRRHNAGREQWLAPEMLGQLEQRLPADAYAMIGLTMVDLYPGEDFNFVFGYASTRNRTGVFSLARYAGEPRKANERAFKILAHETGHMFGMAHCTHYACIMNGVNHAEELDRSPLSLCPVCLRKLHRQTNFDPAARYESLLSRYREADLHDAATFAQQRLSRIEE